MTRFSYVISTCFSVLAIGGLAFVHVSPKLIWNASGSTPIGLYAVASDEDLSVGDLVVVDPPQSLASYLDGRGYLPEGVPLLKHIAALPGQRVCRAGSTVSVDERVVAQAKPNDRFGHALPVWQGCHIVASTELFLLNRDHPDSLDGRYFGALPVDAVIGRAVPILTDQDSDGRYVWRADRRADAAPQSSDRK
ncbi:S26 family signal peptidase [Pelagibacterium halotolerans]|uniref:Conjugal transfer protein n=1 Tax=Pelagibacterium halotolerans (strain DSM 22347 / JCM 15775 / CGMCC 1.7692 / B2) TaxID=1082931 RepID=G4RAU9_PELHB|nr:S26 family signal peptidase [Pelagibacterium halotolerans]AEQ53585.1 conjugal transfer protein precursor [Pelagibacterium halotolerans B2]QJR20241.1 S26 family signal peptidase [Pelagibacterium halotolerans]SEA56920.1 conjugative transfer signal peptidase TraF [Pelagibacterium halotolerans]